MSNTRGTIVHLQICTAHHAPMEHKEALRAIADLGLEGDIHAKPGSTRQVLFLDEETLATFGLRAGRVRENITTRDIELQSLAAGTRMRAGSAVFEITKSCDPCKFIEDIRPGLHAEMEGRRGMLARVIKRGVVSVGDVVEVVNK